MRKFKLGHKTKEDLSDSEVSKYKDFGKVVTNYEEARDAIHAKPLYRQPKTLIILIIIVLIAILIAEVSEKQEDDDSATTPPIEQPIE